MKGFTFELILKPFRERLSYEFVYEISWQRQFKKVKKKKTSFEFEWKMLRSELVIRISITCFAKAQSNSTKYCY